MNVFIYFKFRFVLYCFVLLTSYLGISLKYALSTGQISKVRLKLFSIDTFQYVPEMRQ